MATYLGAEYQLLTTTMGGVPYAEIANAAISAITWELNGWGEATFSLPVNDPQAYGELRKSYQTRREIQIWRNGVLIWWGVYVAATADQDTVTFTAYGLLWYFIRRYFGPVHSNAMPQLMANGNMESSPVTTGWALLLNVTATASTSRRRSGAQSMKLVTTSAFGTECMVGQSVSPPSPARSRPLTMTFSAWQYIEALTVPHPINNAMALGLGGSSALVATRLEPDDPIGRWIYRENEYIVPAGSTAGLSAVLYAPSTGTIYWDDARVTYEQYTGAIEGEDWSDAYLRRIFSYGAGLSGGGVASTTHWGAPVNKSSLGMTWTGSGSAAGSLRADLLWAHADEAVIWQAMADLAARNLLDFEITWPADGRSRTLTTYPPRKGSTKSGLAAEDGRNIVAYRIDADGRRMANDVRVDARAPGKVREVGQAGGPTVATGPQLEAILSPAFELAGSALVEQATAELARLGEPVSMPQITVQAGMYMGDTLTGTGPEAGAPLVVGDSVPVRISSGWDPISSVHRVVKMTLHPEVETLDLVFNAP